MNSNTEPEVSALMLAHVCPVIKELGNASRAAQGRDMDWQAVCELDVVRVWAWAPYDASRGYGGDVVLSDEVNMGIILSDLHLSRLYEITRLYSAMGYAMQPGFMWAGYVQLLLPCFELLSHRKGRTVMIYLVSSSSMCCSRVVSS